MLQQARDHAHYQHLLVRHLAPIVSNLEQPLRQMDLAGPHVTAASANELHTTANELNRLSKTMAPPALWTRAVFWKVTDVRPIFKQLVKDLFDAATAAQSVAREHQFWKATGTPPDFVGEIPDDKLDEYYALLKQTDRIQKADRKFEDQIQTAQLSRDDADSFLQAWQQGNGFVKNGNALSKRSMV